MPEDLRIFLSYAHADTRAIAEQVCGHLNARGHAVFFDKDGIRAGESWPSRIEKELDKSDLVLAFLSHAYHERPVCRAELNRAIRKGKRVIPLLVHRGADRPLRIEETQHIDFTGPLAAALEGLDREIGVGAIKLDKTPRHTASNAPAPPVNYVERTDSLEALRNATIAAPMDRHIALTALRGMGGIGKTVLAQALCHDAAIQAACPDGIVWIDIGANPPDVKTLLAEAASALGNPPDGRDPAACYREAVRTKAALVVLDDVWHSAHLERFRAEAPRARILFTTRLGEIASVTGAREHLADLLSEEQSRAVLAKYAGRPEDKLPPETQDLVRECGRLPLALAMAGVMLRGEDRQGWQDVLELLRSADLAQIEAEFPDTKHSTLLRAIQVSVDALSEDLRERYLQLAIFPKDTEIHEQWLEIAWDCAGLPARRAARKLADRSLLTRDPESGTYRLHDLQHDYLASRYADREALRLIHGAFRLSAHVLVRDPLQIHSQLFGRLMGIRDRPEIARLLRTVEEGRPVPSLWPTSPTLTPPGGPLIRTLTGHSGGVYAVAVTPNGCRAVSASWDQTLKVWDLESEEEVRTLSGHSDVVNAVAVTPSGCRAVSGSADQTLKLWELESGEEVRTLSGHTGEVYAVAVTPNGCRAVSGSADQTLKLWELESGEEVRTLSGHTGEVYAVAVTPDGRRAVSASWDQTLKVWELESGEEVRTLTGHSDVVNAVAVTPDGRRVVSASWDQTLKVWEPESGKEVRTLAGHSDWVRAVAVTPDGRRAVSPSDDQTLKLWDLESGKEVRTLTGHSDWVRAVAVTPDGRRAVSPSDDQTLKLWDLESGEEVRTLTGHSDWVRAVAVTPDGRRAVSPSGDQTLKVWDLESGEEVRTLSGHSGGVNAVAVTPDGRRAVSASQDHTLKVWDLESGEAVRTLTGHSGGVNAVAVTPDGRRAVSASKDQTLKLWDLESGEAVRTLTGHSGGVNAVAVTPDGRRAVSASKDQTLKVWDLESGEAVRTLSGHSDVVNAVAVTPDGRRAVSASGDQTLKVWDLESGEQVRTVLGHSGWLNAVAVTPDGRRAVSGSADQTLKVWELDSGECLATYFAEGATTGCAIAPDNRRVIAGDFGGRLYFLEIVNG